MRIFRTFALVCFTSSFCVLPVISPLSAKTPGQEIDRAIDKTKEKYHETKNKADEEYEKSKHRAKEKKEEAKHKAKEKIDKT